MSQRILSSPVFPPYCWNCTIKDWKSSKQWDSVFILLNGFCSAGIEYLPVTGGKEHSFVGSEQISEIHLNPPVSEKSITDLHTSIHLYFTPLSLAVFTRCCLLSSCVVSSTYGPLLWEIIFINVLKIKQQCLLDSWVKYNSDCFSSHIKSTKLTLSVGPSRHDM